MKRKIAYYATLVMSLISGQAYAEDHFEECPNNWRDYQKQFKYIKDSKVWVSNEEITVRFKLDWPEYEFHPFKTGDEVEFGVTIDPKNFAMPALGHDRVIDQRLVKTDMPCGTNDVHNYSRPSWADIAVPGSAVHDVARSEILGNILNGCTPQIFGGKTAEELTSDEKLQVERKIKFLMELTYPYTYGPVEKAGNFVAVSTCPEDFEKNKEYYFTYFLKNTPDVDSQKEWGYFWIRGKVQPDTLFMKDGYGTVEQVSITDCPYLIGLPPVKTWFDPLDFTVKWTENYIPNNTDSFGVNLFNRGCAPATNIDWGFCDPAKNDWDYVDGYYCRDNDNDKLYDSDYVYPLYGDNIGDCDDRCANVKKKPQLGYPSAPLVKSTYCALRCWGSGCDDDRVVQNTCYIPNWCQVSGGCEPGTFEAQSCGKKGTQQRYCIPFLCTWSDWGACQEKDPGLILGGIFTDDDDIKVVLIPPGGNSGSGGTSSGGSSGTAGTGGTNNQGGAAGTSGAGGNTGSAGTSSCECTSGVCCSGCVFYPASTQCGSTQTYRCEGTNPGDDAQVANVFQFCSGSSNLCNGAITQDAWQTYEACGSTELCLETGGLPYCSAPACSDVYKTTTVQDPCYTNPHNPNSPELCLEMNQISGSTWEYRVCKGNGSGFSNTIKHRLTDQNINHPKQWSWKTYSAGASCTSWVTVDMSYLTQNGTSQGAGLQADVLSPSSCVESSCTLRTGQVGVYKTCE